jgi:hypothetical protein
MGAVFYADAVRATRTFPGLILAALVARLVGCTESGPSGSTSTGTCPMGPQAMFELTITARGGPVPLSTKVDVSWSAGDEPSFILDEPSTWKTIEQANLICDVDPTQPPPHDLDALVCHLWTTGATTWS